MKLSANNIETFKNAVTEMMAYRNRRTRRSEKKIKITSVETDDEIIVEHMTGRFMIGFGAKRFRKFEEEVWSHKIIYNKNTNIVGFENAIINDEDKEGITYYDLGMYEMKFIHF